MPPNHLETRMDAGDAAVSHAPKSPTRRGISDAALRAAKPISKPYKLFAVNGLYLEVKPNGAKHWRWKYRLLGKANRVALGSYYQIQAAFFLMWLAPFTARRSTVCAQAPASCHRASPRTI